MDREPVPSTIVARLERARAFLRASPPHGLALVEDADRLQLATASDCAEVVERHLNVSVPEPLSQAAIESLAVVVYTQPVTRGPPRHPRRRQRLGDRNPQSARTGGRRPAFRGGRGRPAFLVITDVFPTCRAQ
jgi:putative transcriptional regulator (Ypuh-like)